MAWYNASWLYRKKHTITGTADGVQTNYQTMLKVYYGSGSDGTEAYGSLTMGKVYCSSKCKTDFSDLRFTKSDGTTLLDYWIESKVNSNYAIVWVEVDTIAASPSTTDIYMYYGNAAATTASNGVNTFIFFDDFDTLDLVTKWNYWQGSSSFVSRVDASVAYIHSNSTSYTVGLYSRSNIGARGTAMRYRALKEDVTSSGIFHHIGYSINPATNQDNVTYAHSVGVGVYLTKFYGYNGDQPTSANVENIQSATARDTSFHTIDIQYGKVPHLYGQIDTDARWQMDSAYSPTDTTQAAHLVTRGNSGDESGIDWIAVRAWTDVEPTHTSWGAEENQGGGTKYLLLCKV